MTQCEKCKKDFKNLGVHSRYCKGIVEEKMSEVKEIPKLTATSVAEQPQEPAPIPLHMSELREYTLNDVAYFEVEKGKYMVLVPEFIALINNEVYSVLVRTQQGIFMPPFMIPGFVGMFPIDTEIPAESVEPEQPTEEKKALEEISKRTQEDISHEEYTPIHEPKFEEKKVGILDRLRGKTKINTPQTEDCKKTGTDLAQMLQTATK